MRDRKKTLKVGLPALGLMLTFLLSGTAAAAEHAPSPPLEKVTIAYSSMSGNMAPLWITHERGFFRKYGLDAQLVFIQSGSTTVQSLAAKEVAFAQMAGAAVIQSRLRGSDVAMIAGVVNTLTFKFFVDQDIKQPGQLKGKAVAVTRIGSSTDFALRYALQRYGLIPEKDVAIVQAGNMPDILGALQSGKVQGAMLSAPFTLKAKAMGFPVLADLKMLGLEYQHTGLAASQSLINARPDLVRRMIRAYVEGIHYYKTQRRESLEILAKYLKTDDAEVLAEVYDEIGLKLTAEKPYPTVRGIEIMLRELAGVHPKAAAARPEDFVDLSFVKELDESGVIDRLYKAVPVAAAPAERRTASLPKRPDSEAPASAEDASPSAADTLAAPISSPREYVVAAGDTLSHIALKYYGNQFRWDKIYEANKTRMKNPDYIYVGQKLIIPS